MYVDLSMKWRRDIADGREAGRNWRAFERRSRGDGAMELNSETKFGSLGIRDDTRENGGPSRHQGVVMYREKLIRMLATY